MRKEKLELEYPLKATSINMLWNVIGTSYGLSEWFSDDVSTSGEEYSFTWGGHADLAVLLEKKQPDYIRFQWEYDKGTAYYFEIRILKNELSSGLSLKITLFVDQEDKEDEILLWDKHIEDLRRKMGI